MKLTKNFSLREMIYSRESQRLGINNIPKNFKIIYALTLLCQEVLQPIRDHFRKSVHVSSGYRCDKLNKAIGGSRTSQHKKGEAADIEIYGVSNLKLASWIRHNLVFDQLILEYHTSGRPNTGWIHVSFDSNNIQRGQVLSKLSGEKRYRKGLIVR